MVGRIIRDQDCVREGCDWLSEREPRFAYAIETLEEIPLRLKPPGFGALLDAIVSQQISVAAANGIRARMVNASLLNESSILMASDETLRDAGLSRSKVVYARSLAECRIDYSALEALDDAQVIDILTEVKGIGRWTAEIYLMFALGRADAFAAGDLALQESAKLLFDLEKRPTDAALRKMSEAWSPWKAVAARILFAYYRHVKNREGMM